MNGRMTIVNQMTNRLSIEYDVPHKHAQVAVLLAYTLQLMCEERLNTEDPVEKVLGLVDTLLASRALEYAGFLMLVDILEHPRPKVESMLKSLVTWIKEDKEMQGRKPS